MRLIKWIFCGTFPCFLGFLDYFFSKCPWRQATPAALKGVDDPSPSDVIWLIHSKVLIFKVFAGLLLFPICLFWHEYVCSSVSYLNSWSSGFKLFLQFGPHQGLANRQWTSRSCCICITNSWDSFCFCSLWFQNQAFDFSDPINFPKWDADVQVSKLTRLETILFLVNSIIKVLYVESKMYLHW